MLTAQASIRNGQMPILLSPYPMILAGGGERQNNERRNKARTPDKGLVIKETFVVYSEIVSFYHLYSGQEGLQRVKWDIGL
jgi:hypothetical protein